MSLTRRLFDNEQTSDVRLSVRPARFTLEPFRPEGDPSAVFEGNRYDHRPSEVRLAESWCISAVNRANRRVWSKSQLISLASHQQRRRVTD
jgi:hypothetical protein